jgi:hypothetical protein
VSESFVTVASLLAKNRAAFKKTALYGKKKARRSTFERRA